MVGQYPQRASFDLPDRFRVEVRRRDPGGDAWLSGLSTLWQEMSDRWGLSLAGRTAVGSVSLVIPVRRSNGLAALKLVSPAIDAGEEAAALSAFNGRGAVRLLAADVARQALLLEWLAGPTLTAEPDVAKTIGIAGAVAQQLTCTPAPDGVRTLAGGAVKWIELLHEQHAMALQRGSAAPDDLFALVLAIVRELGKDTTETLTHGDLSLSNIMSASQDQWVAIDPYLLAGTAANEAHTVIRSHLPVLLASRSPSRLLHDWTAMFCDAAAVDAGQAQRVSLARYLASYYWEAQHGGDPGNVENLRLGLLLTADQV